MDSYINRERDILLMPTWEAIKWYLPRKFRQWLSKGTLLDRIHFLNKENEELKALVFFKDQENEQLRSVKG